MNTKLGHKRYRLKTVIQRLADEAVENGDINRDEYDLVCWHLNVLHTITNNVKEAENANNKTENKSGT